MLFNSLEFAIFLPIVFLIYWAIGFWNISDKIKLNSQNAFVIIASYLFYGWWDWRFMLLIAFTSFCSWGTGLLIKNASTQRIAKAWVAGNIIINISILAIFKYYDFFVHEFGVAFGCCTDNLLLHLILPVGISFYTFQALSYSIDVYREKIEPTKDIIAFFAFIAFFPQLVAGPIERATNLLPQFQRNRTFSYDIAIDGMRQILWGLFKKIVIADNCASYVDQIWQTYNTQTSSTLLLAAVLFSIQIYGDFSGYSDIAIGTAKLFGIQLMRNFNNPYFSRDIAEFWRKWHISLTTWFRDYVYIPLGGSRVSQWKIVRNTFVIFLLSGFWHGANWTFIGWGTYHAVLFLPLILSGRNRRYTGLIAEGRYLPSLQELIQMLLTFCLVVIGWVIFRAETITQAWDFLYSMCSPTIFSIPSILPGLKHTLLYVAIMVAIEWFQRNQQHALATKQPNKYKLLRVIFYYALIFLIIRNIGPEKAFIYFQF